MIPLLWKRALQTIKRTQAVFRLFSTRPPTDTQNILKSVPSLPSSASPDPFLSKYGDVPTSQTISAVSVKTWTRLRDLSEQLTGQKVWLRARVHSTRIKGKGGFLILRESSHTAQCTIFVGSATSKEMVKYVSGITPESVVDVLGVCKTPQVPIAKCSQKHVEVEVEEVHVVSRAETPLPLQIQDASGPITVEDEEASDQKQDNIPSPDERKRAKVSLKTRLDNRVLDLRTPASQAILQLNSTVCHLFRDFLSTQGFTEIHTPKLLPGSSEGGADVFKVNYFGRESCLAQSPQLYKQMALMADLDRVYEVGPVFRAEDSNTHRHLCEFTGLDLEMTIKDHYFELTNLIHDMCKHIFEGVERKHVREIAAIREQFQFLEPFKYTQKPLMFTFSEAARFLSEAGMPQSLTEDFTTDHEKKLGAIVKEKFGTDFYIVHRYPSSVRPFYTLPCVDDPLFTCSFDVFMRGEEILSGGQRVHDAKVLEQRIREKGMEVEPLRDYVNSFKYGAFPHGGCGVGLERVVMLYLGLKNIRRVSMFPRDPKRLSP